MQNLVIAEIEAQKIIEQANKQKNKMLAEVKVHSEQEINVRRKQLEKAYQI